MPRSARKKAFKAMAEGKKIEVQLIATLSGTSGPALAAPLLVDAYMDGGEGLDHAARRTWASGLRARWIFRRHLC